MSLLTPTARELAAEPVYELLNTDGPYADGAFPLTPPAPTPAVKAAETPPLYKSAVRRAWATVASLGAAITLDTVTDNWRPDVKARMTDELHAIVREGIAYQPVHEPIATNNWEGFGAEAAVIFQPIAVALVGVYMLATMHKTIEAMGGYRLLSRAMLGRLSIRSVRRLTVDNT